MKCINKHPYNALLSKQFMNIYQQNKEKIFGKKDPKFDLKFIVQHCECGGDFSHSGLKFSFSSKKFTKYSNYSKNTQKKKIKNQKSHCKSTVSQCLPCHYIFQSLNLLEMDQKRELLKLFTLATTLLVWGETRMVFSA